MKIESKRYFDVIVIGTGCAGYNAADWLYDLGCRNICVMTEGINMGTSRNAGSDKQTYYKLSIASDGGDSVRDMAEALFSGGGMHGDTALVEASCSVKAFMKLNLLGVPFPTNEYGEYIGYKTDHDPRQRGTSCGPLTSRLMTEALENSVNKKGVEIIDDTQVIKLLTEGNEIAGVVCVNTKSGDYHVYACGNVILATGGPAGVYYHSVYPESQTGSTGLALAAGACAQNLCEWQYGIASTKFRWNVSGSYQQALPRYIAVGPDKSEREFLPHNFNTAQEALDMVFLKGYQWPFDVRKIYGSSRIDMLVHNEIRQGNRVYIDFSENPAGLSDGFGKLSDEAHRYLKNCGALFGTPVERLNKINPLAVKLYNDNGIDLCREPLEIAVCAQHCNGGVAVDTNWESSVKGLYAVGEAAGTFGVYRPGGSALNSTQVGSMRAAEHVAHKQRGIGKAVIADIPDIPLSSKSNVAEKLLYTRRAMSDCASFLRNPQKMKNLLNIFASMLESSDLSVAAQSELPAFYKFCDTLTTQTAVLSAMILSAEVFGSRGSGLVEGLESGGNKNSVVITEGFSSRIEPVRPIPEGGGWFETVWNQFNHRNKKAGDK